NIQNDDNNDASPLPKSSTRNQNQRSVTFGDEAGNSSISHVATNILDMLSENDNEDNDDSQYNDIY
ncbi:12258_t:CDS:2, partial [Dentiscutata heterogama]